MAAKLEAKKHGVEINTFESNMSWNELKLNSDGMIPVVVQDYKNLEVLMVAYMNREAFEKTVESGKMTYWSRSRNELWQKGATSGHVQYVKQLSIDCDNDTILAKVQQIGAACHTGNRSCFYREILKKDYHETNPAIVFDHLYKLCLLYTSDAADEEDSVDLGGCRIIKKKNTHISESTFKTLSHRPMKLLTSTRAPKLAGTSCAL